MSKRKICVVTGTRADYGHLYWLMKEIQNDHNLELQILVTGMHLSPEFGLTYRQIEKDGFKITKKVEMLMSSDTEVGISKSIGLGCISFSEAFKDIKPDIIVVLGDRYEILAASIAAMVAQIPIAHIHGGELTEGVIDNQIRHAITKLASIHFPVTEEYARRVIQMGERPETVFNHGAPGLDNIYRLKLLSKEQLEETLNFKFEDTTAIFTYNPVTLEPNTTEEQIQTILDVLEKFDFKIIFTKANSDTYGRIINEKIEQFVDKNSNRAIFVSNLGQLRYLSVLKYADIMIGNSSSGIIEGPSFKIPVVNIGDRQKGRIRAENVIDVGCSHDEIMRGIMKGLSREFKDKISNCKNPYDIEGAGNISYRIKETLKKIDLNQNLIKKHFFDLKFKI
ncbi:UDP-N-acetyl-D-glucosamine 2-epimerase, UDP-hydrolysing [Anoxybacter fermentans]|uniref:UDP-N-acetyl-D-glucosamine 2-epimerase, UDP-hydrolysing n=1 Tax=Anoxybacter fermentans TaxID=1323375 RepID=A0A3Q9HRG7_9FIRM|nr:UDP-N-acetylglucosamine 2-epimerase [Anoxybacter fermentans]AZR73885.1 UDP-N-acetyl-D-glucosamine 2-epimerase, UDP-hydrolysing [Anoxybacter fermentans]